MLSKSTATSAAGTGQSGTGSSKVVFEDTANLRPALAMPGDPRHRCHGTPALPREKAAGWSPMSLDERHYHGLRQRIRAQHRYSRMFPRHLGFVYLRSISVCGARRCRQVCRERSSRQYSGRDCGLCVVLRGLRQRIHAQRRYCRMLPRYLGVVYLRSISVCGARRRRQVCRERSSRR